MGTRSIFPPSAKIVVGTEIDPSLIGVGKAEEVFLSMIRRTYCIWPLGYLGKVPTYIHGTKSKSESGKN